MKQTKLIMGMPITIEVIDAHITKSDINKIFDYFTEVDKRYSTYKANSEISQINNGLPKKLWSSEVKKVLKLCEQTKNETQGYFNIHRNGQIDPSGLVKGWAINNAANKLIKMGYKNFYIDAGGDLQVKGRNTMNKAWTIGIRNPFNREQIVKTVAIKNKGVATSGTYVRGFHIYNPQKNYKSVNEIASLTVIGPNIYEADRFATAAFAMGLNGIEFIESLVGYEAYMIDNKAVATMTSGFESYVVQ